MESKKLSQKDLWNKKYKQNKIVWHKETLSLPIKLKDKIVLELGVGNGKTLKTILKEEPKEIHCIDFSKEALKKCQKEFKDDSIKYYQEDITSLSFQDSYFDAIIGYYIFNNLSLSKQNKAVSQIYRMLKPQGKFIFQDFMHGDFRQKNKEKEIYCHFFKISEVKKLLKRFRIERIKEIEYSPFLHSEHPRKIIQIIGQKD